MNLQNKKIAILGLGLENLALVKYILKQKINCEITVCDARTEIRGKNRWIPPASCGAGMTKIRWQLGKNFNKDLGKFHILFRSPGWPLNCPGVKAAMEKSAEISSPMKLFFELCPSKNIIGVTGTKGKGTTASLIYEILKQAGRRAWLGGNIGVAPFEFIDKIRRTDWVVLELSSFQLEDIKASPHIAVVTNFFPEHLTPADPHNPNYHKTLKEYLRAKKNIVKGQKRYDYAVINEKLEIRDWKFVSEIITFGKSELPSRLIGEHNKENVAAAVEVVKIIGVKPGVIKKAVANFKGLEHRLELARECKGVKYYDDSFATTPEAAITALKSFSQPIIVLLGGADKGSDFSRLAEEVKKRCKFVVLLDGKATPRIKEELLKVKFAGDRMKLANNIQNAVAEACKQAVRGDVVLLSTACASFGMFKNYKERGDLFKKQVKK